MDVLSFVRGAPGNPVPSQASRRAVRNAGQHRVPTGARWRFALERRWEQKLDEVIALAGACQGVSAAGDDLPGDGMSLPAFRLYCRAAAASEDLAVIGDAIARLDNGTFGRCQRCKHPMPDAWLVRDPVQQYCLACSLRRRHPTAFSSG